MDNDDGGQLPRRPTTREDLLPVDEDQFEVLGPSLM